ncbi:MAG: Hsp20/alpha crystallin family protein [Burkholderiaceae bacterium]
MARLSVYDPFADVFPELFRGLLATPTRNGERGVDLKLDVSENEAGYEVQAEIPGVRKEDIHVQIDGNRVSISAEVKRETEKKEGDRVLRSERFFGTVSRSFALGSELDEAAAIARFENGVLTLSLPKKAAPAAKRLTIS